MKKHIVLSVNSNADYMYFAPLALWAWRYFGWEPILFYHQAGRNIDANGNRTEISFIEELIDKNGVGTPVFIKDIEGYRSDTITQISRLYAGIFLAADSYVMTGDIDMIPLSNYWNPMHDDVTVYGHDLTGFGHYPICYIGMMAMKWREVMQMGGHSSDFHKCMQRDLNSLPQAKDPDFYKYWFSDQDLITSRLNEYGDKIQFINRGQGTHGYARGRVDRGNGGWVIDQPELIDAHMEQQTHHSTAKIGRLFDLLRHVWPNENFDWFAQYTTEFRKITGHTG